MKITHAPGVRTGIFLVATSVLCAAGVILACLWYYRTFEKQYRARVHEELLLVTELKTRELSRWRTERLSDAATLSMNPVFSDLVQNFLERPGDATGESKLREWLEKYQVEFGYQQIGLVDNRGASRLVTPTHGTPLSATIGRLTPEALKTRRTFFADFYRNEFDGMTYTALLVPIYKARNTDVALGAVVMRIDPRAYLFPVIDFWPTTSRSAETVLIRRDGDSLCFLNKLKFLENSAMGLRIPMSRRDLPVVRAVSGEKGVVIGNDYRGVPVVEALSSVPDSPWFVCSKLDLAEVNEPLTRQFWQTVGIMAILLLFVGGSLWLVWRQMNTQHLYETARARADLAERERVHREQLIQADKMATVGRLVSGVAHEINNPNNFIMLNAPLLRRAWESALPAIRSNAGGSDQAYVGKMRLDEFTEHVLPLVDGIVEGSSRIARIVADLKDYARPDACDLNGHVDVVHVVRSAVNLMHNTLVKTNVELHLSLNETPVMVQGSFQRLEQVVINLLQNSCDAVASSGNGRQVSVALDSAREKDVTLCVCDTGCGIAPEDLSHITEPFFTTKRGSGGTGLGLSVSSRIVSEHGGRLLFESEVGKGTTVNLILPRRRG